MSDPLDEIFGPHEFDGTPWKQLRDTVLVYLAVLPSCERRPQLAFPPDEDSGAISEAKRQIMRIATGALPEGMTAMLYRNREDSWPDDISDQALFALTVALDQIAEFLKLCYDDDEGRLITPFRYQGQSDGALALWFFVRWWMGPGIRHWLDQVVTDRRMFGNYFDEQPRAST